VHNFFFAQGKKMTEVAQKSFRLKADMVALTVMQLQTINLGEIAVELKLTISKAPRFFEKAPLVIDVREVNANGLDLAGLLGLFKEYSIVPIGIRGLNELQQTAAEELGLPCLQAPSVVEGKPAVAKQSAAAPLPEGAKVLTKAVRAGTKVYAKGQDLIVIGPVNVGAECIADGNIHVYGPLRGRALAGASGNAEARIFCHSLEAELIAIAGHYQVRENMQVPTENAGMLQIFLSDNKLSIKSI
jgi:septum site-determining protein MinC